MMNVTNANYYFDTSALLPYYRQEDLTPKVQAFISAITPPILINHLTLVEMASALSRWCRTSELSEEQASMINDSRTFLSAHQSEFVPHFTCV